MPVFCLFVCFLTETSVLFPVAGRRVFRYLDLSSNCIYMKNCFELSVSKTSRMELESAKIQGDLMQADELY